MLVKERVYLGGFEIYRELDTSGPTLERQTLHIMDDKRRVALVESAAAESLTRYQLDNHLGSSCLELDENAAVISYEEFYPYGSTSYQAVDKSITAAGKRYRYTSKERDEENGLYYHGARYYAAWLGRWTATDPLGIPDRPNAYSYVGNRPTQFRDPSGTLDEKALAQCASGPPGERYKCDWTAQFTAARPEERVRASKQPAKPPSPQKSSKGNKTNPSRRLGPPPPLKTFQPPEPGHDGKVLLVGGLQFAGGGWEMVAASTALLNCGDTLGAGCIVAAGLFLHGLDTATSGMGTVADEKISLTYTNRLGQGAAGLVTDSKAAQKWTGVVFDATTGMALSFGTATLVDIPVANSNLVHLARPSNASALNAAGAVFNGPSGVYAGPACNASVTAGVGVTFRTGLSPFGQWSPVPIPAGASGAFFRPLPMGPLTAWQNITGQVHTGAGLLDMTTGAFTSTGTLWHHVPFYAADAAVTTGLAAGVPPLAKEREPAQSQ
jgi:RHS repeat-associated protein